MLQQQNSSNIPVSTNNHTTQKKKGANSSYVPPAQPRGNMSSYVGSMSGSLQDNVVKADPLSF